jgi:hypothetical protein
MLSIHRSESFNYILLTAVPIFLAAIHFFTPDTLQQALAFDHTRFNGYTLLTAAYVHASDAHLCNNLIGYALTATYAYALCLTVDELAWFRSTFLVHLLTLPHSSLVKESQDSSTITPLCK